MKRRTFIKAIFGVLAAIYAPASLLRVAPVAARVYDPLELDMDKLRDTGCPATLMKRIEERRQKALELLADLIEDDVWNPSTKGNPTGIPFFVT